MYTPYLEVDLEKIRHNTRKTKALLDAHGIEMMFITKGFCADVPVIETVKSCGVRFFGDSRMLNIIHAKRHIPEVKYCLIRIPKLSELKEVVAFADYSLQSQIEVIRATSEEAIRQDKVHKIILMIDVGDLREGAWPDELDTLAPQIKECKGVELVGVGTNVGCYGSILPSVENTSILVKYRDYLNENYGFHITMISGGSTCALPLVEEDRLDPNVNLFRVGECIVCGSDSTGNRRVPGLYDDAFVLYAEVVELRRKPSMPIGERGRDAFGHVNEYVDRGVRARAICAAGKQDVTLDALEPMLPGAELIGASSDHLIVDVENCIDQVQVGTLIPFRCGYTAVLAATTSRYVDLVVKEK